MAFIAHRKITEDGAETEQLLRDHCRAAAGYSSAALAGTALQGAACLAGLLHDMGKYTSDFQDYLSGVSQQKRGSVIHSFQGCRYLLEQYHDAEDPCRRLTAELLAYAVGAHHGLFDCVDSARKLGFRQRRERTDIAYPQARDNFLADCAGADTLDGLFCTAYDEISAAVEKLGGVFADDGEFAFSLGLLARLLLSAVIEGDRRDTAEFMNNARFPAWPEEMSGLWRERLAHTEALLGELKADTPVNRARQAISDRCRDFAEKPCGIYRLNVPTGGGKTLSSLRFALGHAARWNKRRIIFLSPLLSILEQNAAVVRRYVGDDSLILEHHSNVVQTMEGEDRLDERELLTESWDAPIIITTLVQFLNTLFEGRTTAIRRFHGLCGSVIVIDEVQTVPNRMLTLFNLSIRFLAEICGATVVLCSATQPCFERAEHPLGMEPEDIVPYDPLLWEPFRRTKIVPLGRRRTDELAGLVREIMARTDSLLVVCNKKDEAAGLFMQLQAEPWRCFHLSAAMCMQHRRDTLAALQEALAPERRRDGEKVLCVATQVIEAGVDISFSRVIRLSAGMDSVVQAAGRCNRNGDREEPQPVYLVDCADENLSRLPEIRQAKTATGALLERFAREPESCGGDLASDAAIACYYRQLYQNMSQGAQDYPLSDKRSLFDLLSVNGKYADARCEGLEDYLLWQAFKEAGQAFQVFDDNSTDVLVPYGEGRQLIGALCTQRAEHDVAYRAGLIEKAKAYAVAVYDYQLKKLAESGGVHLACGSVYVLGEGCYDENTGLRPEENKNEYMEV